MEEAILTILASIALAGVCGVIGYFMGMDKHVKDNSILRVENAEYRMELDERDRRINELLDMNKGLMKQLNAKQENVSRETSYNKSYGLPEVTDWINKNYPSGGDK